MDQVQSQKLGNSSLRWRGKRPFECSGWRKERTEPVGQRQREDGQENEDTCNVTLKES